MEKETRSAIETATQKARRLLEADFQEQLDGVFDVRSDGRIAAEPGAHLDAGQRRVRRKIVAAIEHKRAGGMRPAEAVADYLRDAAFTVLNRIVALKMLEARDLVQPCVSQVEASAGFIEFCGLAPGVRTPDGAGYRLYLECIFDELSTEVKVLFDRRDAPSALWPRRAAFLKLLEILNEPALASIWGEDETIGWVYQYFNGQEERKAMRAESQAPQNSRELAIRNQFFTPRYVVQFLTDNTLGRIWYEMRDGKTALSDQCEYMVRRPDESWAARAKKDPRDIRVLDPACGSGHFLLYAFDLLATIYEEAWADETSPPSEDTGASLREDFADIDALKLALPGLILAHNLHGVDIDPRCAQIAQLALWMRAQRAFQQFGVERSRRPAITKSNVVIAEPMPGEADLRDEFLRDLSGERLAGLMRRALDIPEGSPVRATKAMADSLAALVEVVWDGMKLAGELGVLLKIERTIKTAIEKGRNEWELELPLFRVAEYGMTASGLAPLKEQVARLVPGEVDDFWSKAERIVFRALEEYADDARGAGVARRRLFADDAAHGFALVDLTAHRFDVILMNPPFGLPAPNGAQYISDVYSLPGSDIYPAFYARTFELVGPSGVIGAITPRSFLYQVDYVSFRSAILKSDQNFSHCIELGLGVMDGAMVRSVCTVWRRGESRQKTSYAAFEGVGDPEEWMRNVKCSASQVWNISEFSDLLGTPFIFKLSGPLGEKLKVLPRLDPVVGKSHTGGRNGMVRISNGLQTGDNFRFVRLRRELDRSINSDWKSFLKPTGYQPYVSDDTVVVLWGDSGKQIKAFFAHQGASPSRYVSGEQWYGELGLWFPGVSEVGMGAAICRSPSIGSRTGLHVVISEAIDARTLTVFLNSDICYAFLLLWTPDRHHQPSYVGQIPFWLSGIDQEECISIFDEIQKALEPYRGDVSGAAFGNIIERALFAEDGWSEAVSILRNDTATIGRLVDLANKVVLRNFPGDLADIESLASLGKPIGVEQWFPSVSASPEAWLKQKCSTLFLSLCFNGAEKDLPHLSIGAVESSELFGAIAARLKQKTGIARTDVVDWLDKFLKKAFGNGDLSSSLWQAHFAESTEAGRKAPVYWQLATPSGSYGVWLHIHAFSKDTVFRIQNDYVAPKLAHERRQLESLLADAGASPTSAQAKGIEAQESFVEELSAMLDEVRRVAPLWDPDLDDGVLLNFAPLWRLVPQNRAWQKELRAAWASLVAGDYDWARLSMRFWPERVVPKCAKDRSLAIAHGLEDVFWFEDAAGKWQPRSTPSRPINDLIAERASPAVEAALQSLIEAPDLAAASGRSRRRKKS